MFFKKGKKGVDHTETEKVVSAPRPNTAMPAAGATKPNIDDFLVLSYAYRRVNPKNWPGVCGAIAHPVADPDGAGIVANMFVRHKETQVVTLWSGTWVGVNMFDTPDLAQNFCFSDQGLGLAQRRPEIYQALVKNWTR